MPGEATRQAALLQALDRADCRTVERLAEESGLEPRAVVAAAAGLIGRGFAERAERGCFLLTAEGERARRDGTPLASGPRARLTQRLRRPRRITLQDKLWRGLRAARKATLPQLLRLADRDDAAGRSGAQRYLKALQRGGYLRQMPRRDRAGATGVSSPGHLVWLLVKDTGPLAPALRAQRDGSGRRELFDRNLQAAVPLDGAP